MDKTMLTPDKITRLNELLEEATEKEVIARKKLEDEIGPNASVAIIVIRIDELYTAQSNRDKIAKLLSAAMKMTE